jgi:hypothetical protein
MQINLVYIKHLYISYKHPSNEYLMNIKNKYFINQMHISPKNFLFTVDLLIEY